MKLTYMKKDEHVLIVMIVQSKQDNNTKKANNRVIMSANVPIHIGNPSSGGSG